MVPSLLVFGPFHYTAWDWLHHAHRGLWKILEVDGVGAGEIAAALGCNPC